MQLPLLLTLVIQHLNLSLCIVVHRPEVCLPTSGSFFQASSTFDFLDIACLLGRSDGHLHQPLQPTAEYHLVVFLNSVISGVYRGYTGEIIFQVRCGGSRKSFLFIVDGGIRTHDPKNPWAVDDAIF